jgi:hypothetical protein
MCDSENILKDSIFLENIFKEVTFRFEQPELTPERIEAFRIAVALCNPRPKLLKVSAPIGAAREI